MTFHRKKSPVLFDYKIDNISLEKVHLMKDLCVIFDPTFSFVRHVAFIVTKAYSILGFTVRICVGFNAAAVFKSLYFSRSMDGHILTCFHFLLQSECQTGYWFESQRQWLRNTDFFSLPSFVFGAEITNCFRHLGRAVVFGMGFIALWTNGFVSAEFCRMNYLETFLTKHSLTQTKFNGNYQYVYLNIIRQDFSGKSTNEVSTLFDRASVFL